MIVGFPFGLGVTSTEDVGALSPTSGTGYVGRAFGDSHEINSC